MPLTFHPTPGLVLMCDFTTGFREPEMVKNRPVVVVSGKFQRTSHENSLCTVVPISTVPPKNPDRWHHKLETASVPPPLRRHGEESWAKCDMVVSVAFHRLNLVRTERVEGKRRFAAHYVIPEDLRAIQSCLLFVLNMANLIPRPE